MIKSAMSVNAYYLSYDLRFAFTARTSRGAMHEKTSWFIVIKGPKGTGVGEAAPLKGLSPDDRADFQKYLTEVVDKLPEWITEADKGETAGEVVNKVSGNVSSVFPALRFGVETAVCDYLNGGKQWLYPSLFRNGEEGIPINGLIWMGEPGFMHEQIDKKLAEGFHVIKMKVGALDFEAETEIIKDIRKKYSSRDLSIRLDANGAYHFQEASEKLKRLAQFAIHSIEQPLPAGRRDEMASLVKSSPVPVALDEELIGVNDYNDKEELLDYIAPHYIILKPTLTGGIKASEEWIELAEKKGTGWWLTSALESDIGLNAITQFAGYKNVSMPQGLGTGKLYTNNIPSPLTLRGEELWYDPEKSWDFSGIPGKGI